MGSRVRQLFVAASAYLAAISAGATIGYPTVLLQQFKGNGSAFHVEADTLSWIGSIQGIAGIPSILMPTIMQIKGRKFAYFISCLILAAGWIIIFLAENITTIIVGQFFLGFGSNSLVPVAYLTLSEMIEPKCRSISLLFIGVFLSGGISVVHALGRSFCWSVVDAIMFMPLLISASMSLFWVESPAWLAYKFKFEKCKIAFTLLRGNSDSAAKELRELVQLEKCDGVVPLFKEEKRISKRLYKTLLRRDYYWPCFHTIVILLQMYWGGNIVVYIYSSEMLQETTSNQTAISIGLVFIDVVVIFGAILSLTLLNYFDSKFILLASATGVTICLTSTCVFKFLQCLGYLSKDSLLGFCSLLGFITSSNIGISSLSFSLPSELIPVKHKSSGGALIVICCSVLHFSVLKSFPYMLDYFGLIGTFTCFNIVTLSCMFYIWKCVPKTRHKTLQEIELSYNKHESDIGIDDSENITERADFIGQTTIHKFQ